MENTWGKYFQFKLLGRQHILKEKLPIISLRSMIKCVECVPVDVFSTWKLSQDDCHSWGVKPNQPQVKHWPVVFGILSHPLAPKTSVILVAQFHCSSHRLPTGEAPVSLYSFRNLAWWYAQKSCSDGCGMRACLQSTESGPHCISFLPWARVP